MLTSAQHFLQGYMPYAATLSQILLADARQWLSLMLGAAGPFYCGQSPMPPLKLRLTNFLL